MAASGDVLTRPLEATADQHQHVKYHWDGRRVGRYFDYATESWHPVWR